MVWHAHRRRSAIGEARRYAESEHRLVEGQRAFVRDASLELRTPITVARGHAELIRDSGVDGQVATDAGVVLDELGRLSNLSKRLLLLTAAEDPGFLSPADIELEPLAVGLMRRWSPTALRAWQVQITAEGTIRADRERLETALDALMENALNATDEGDAIRVGCRREGDVVVLEISDEGKGIRADALPRILERFSTIGSHRSRRNGGTGLGLSIAKAIAHAHGGLIEVESEEGRGATFRIFLSGSTHKLLDQKANPAAAPG